MKVLQQSSSKILEFLGGLQYKTKNRKYRFNKYCTEVDLGDRKIIYNAFTGALVIMYSFEYDNIFTEDPCDYSEFLVNNYFLVPENFDERSLVDIYRERNELPIIPGYLDHPTTFTILTTTKCNARCFYCYEKNSKGKTHMTMETAEKVIKYILEVVPKDKQIEIGWFGGEPLFNSKVINHITSRIAAAGIKFRGSMISNGYLFDDNLIEKAKNVWRLTNVQITLDGTEEIYNSVKNYIYKNSESPYKKVIENIHKLLRSNIRVSVRMNCDYHNSENLKKLVVELKEEFKNYNNFSMYVWPIFEEGFTRTPEQKEQLYKSLLEIEDIILESGYGISHGITNGIKYKHCMVDGGNGVIISPNGDLGVCEHFIDSDFIGHINDPYDKNQEILCSWRDYVKPTEICNDCPLYPTCLKMKKCPDETQCEEFQKMYHIENLKKDMIYRGKEFLEKSQREKNENCGQGKCCNKH